MSLLKTEPPQPVQSLEELFAIAYAMEKESATRYAELAERMRVEANPALTELFRQLSAEESGHVDSVVHWSEKQKGRPPDPELIRWNLPETFDDEGVASVSPQLLSAYRALSMAVRNEERAFAFWSYVSAQAGLPEIRSAAETMAHEELRHVAMLRRERRRAYHAERAGGSSPTTGQREGRIATPALERRLAERLQALSMKTPDDGRQLELLASEALRNADELTRAPFHGNAREVPTASIPDDPVALAELLVDRYLQAADEAREESDLAKAQDFAARAINRLSWLRADLPGIGRA